MALCKPHINPDTGVITNYHRISSVSVRNGSLSCGLEGYVSKEYRDHGISVEYQTYLFDITVEEEESMGIRQLAYKKIKELSEWKDAEDC